MTDKTLYTLHVSGNDVTLKFRVGALRILKRLLGKDPLKALADADTFEAIELGLAIMKAGWLSVKPETPETEIEAIYDDLTDIQVTDLITGFTKAYSPDPDPAMEGKENTQGEAA